MILWGLRVCARCVYVSMCVAAAAHVVGRGCVPAAASHKHAALLTSRVNTEVVLCANLFLRPGAAPRPVDFPVILLGCSFVPCASGGQRLYDPVHGACVRLETGQQESERSKKRFSSPMRQLRTRLPMPQRRLPRYLEINTQHQPEVGRCTLRPRKRDAAARGEGECSEAWAWFGPRTKTSDNPRLMMLMTGLKGASTG